MMVLFINTNFPQVSTILTTRVNPLKAWYLGAMSLSPLSYATAAACMQKTPGRGGTFLPATRESCC